MNSVNGNPPWQLSGSGYIIIYKFSKKEVQSNFFLSEKFTKLSTGGTGMIIIADYEKSTIGPYKELLIIPGIIKYNNKNLKTISKIFVSTEESVFYGRKNWGIPKEKADFTDKKDKNKTHIKVSVNDTSFFEISLTSYGPSFPVTTSLLPLSIIQEYDGKAFYTKPKGSGLGKISLIKNISVDSNLFPNIANKKPLFAIKVNPFKMTFPLPKIEHISNS